MAGRRRSARAASVCATRRTCMPWVAVWSARPGATLRATSASRITCTTHRSTICASGRAARAACGVQWRRCHLSPSPCTSPRRFTRESLTGSARVRRGFVLCRRGAGATPLGRRVRRVPLEPQAARRAAAGDRGGGAAAAGARSPQSSPCVPSRPSPTLLVAPPHPKVVQHELSNLASLDASQLRVRNARLEIAELLSLKCPGCRPSRGFSAAATVVSRRFE